MNKVLLIVILVFIGCQNKNKNDTNSTAFNGQIESVKGLSNNILTAQKNGDFYKLSEKEATLKMVNGLNEIVQKESYKHIKKLFGDYQGLKFESVEDVMEVETYKVYRFKGDFELGLDVEVRSVINAEGKLAGFFVKPWQDNL